MRARPLQLLVLLAGILAVSTASILIRYAQPAASSLTIAAGRLLFATLALAPFALVRHRAALALLTGGDSVLAGVEALTRGADDFLPRAKLTPRAMDRLVRRLLTKGAGPAPPAPDLDPLTQLGGRDRFQGDLRRTLAAAQRHGQPFTLLVLALDELQALAGGQAAVDAVLAGAGHRLAASGRARDAFFRIGPARFAALLGPGSDDAAAVRRLQQLIEQPIDFGGRPLAVAVRIGAARFPADGRRPEALLACAEAALARGPAEE